MIGRRAKILLWRIEDAYYRYPRQFWILMAGTFVDRIGAGLIFPFLSLYVTAHFHVGVVEVGKMFFVLAVSGFFGELVGGALTDKFGRKGMIVFGLAASGLTSVLLGL